MLRASSHPMGRVPRPRIACLLTLLVCFSGCSGLRAGRVSSRLAVATLPPIDVIQGSEPIWAQHHLILSVPGRSFSMLGAVERVDGTLTVAAVSPLGGRVFLIRHDGRNGMPGEAAVAPRAIPPERILRDFLLIYGDAAALRQQGFAISEGESLRRIRTADGEEILIRYSGAANVWRSRVRFENRNLRYQITIEPIENDGRVP